MTTREEALRVRRMDIREVVDDPEWQEVRKSLIGNWVRNHIRNVKTLRDYLDRHEWSALAVRRVGNVLTGTVHRVGHTAGQGETDELRLEVRQAWATMLGGDPSVCRGPI